ncbi:Tyrosine recombinase XerC [Rubripirellula obstinata]|uniref:Tyrosine recombinase XerC n=1 Tax=Rubripirellula obstinata TaxID=406547 RepID=A0A5B1CSA3_9BACT|nr:tyrosine-type recombinase/integrase [Rubripirellula obstinata]KAA1262094.1 Tyrosine recombinase XerC [Rubripirellula obstinata]
MRTPTHRYTTGIPYRIARGRQSEPPAVSDRLARDLAVIDLDEKRPRPSIFLKTVRRELKIRCYSPRTVKAYVQAATSVLRWLGCPPDQLRREHVRRYLEYLHDAGHGPSDMGVQLSAIRTIWDKMCYRDVTLGLETPRKKRHRPVVPSRDEVRRLLAAAPSLRDTLLLGLMYGTGMRVSEVCQVRWRDVDVDRQQIFIKQGKGNADRHVQLPQQYQDLFKSLLKRSQRNEFVFAGESQSDRRQNRHLSPRTVQRLVKTATKIAGITKKLTPHSLRHAFATHSYEDGCDIRRIQKVLGHVRLDTTTIYISVAKERTSFASPLDRLSDAATSQKQSHGQQTQSQQTEPSRRPANPVGGLRLHCRMDPSDDRDIHRSRKRHQFTIEIRSGGRREYLLGSIAQQIRPGFVQIDLPPIEDWQASLSRLPSSVAKRMDQPEFYQTLQQSISDRLIRETAAASDTTDGPVAKQGSPDHRPPESLPHGPRKPR